MTADIIDLGDVTREAGEADSDNAFIVDLEGYEGPLHLLLDMARRQKVDLLEISILKLAKQYLTFIEAAKSKRIDLAADYLLMAAWLAYLKSRLLLPKPEKATSSDAEPEDMAVRLAFRLKRLEAMREAGQALQDGAVLNTSVFLRGCPEQPKVIKRTQYDTTLYHLTQAFGAIRQRREEAAPHRVEHQYVLQLETARNSLRNLLPDVDDWAALDVLRDRVAEGEGDIPVQSATASMFAASLELVRDGDVDVRQDGHFAPLYLKRRALVMENGGRI